MCLLLLLLVPLPTMYSTTATPTTSLQPSFLFRLTLIHLFVRVHLCSTYSFCFARLPSTPQHALRRFSACLAASCASRSTSDGQEVSTRASTRHGKERPGHSDECNYSIALLIPPDLVVPSLALARVLWLERSRTSWDVPDFSRYAFPFETLRRRPARAN